MRTVLAAALAPALVLAMTAGGAMAAPQFNLDCTGARTLVAAGAKASEEPWSEHYRLDLPWSQYCQGACEGPRILTSVQPDILVFYDAEDAASKDFAAVSRETGEYYSLHVSRPSLDGWIISGRCTPTPFTSMPTVVR